MTWQRRIATMLLAVLAGMPVAASACAFACDPALNAVAARHGGHACEEAAPPPSTGVQIGGRTDHDCSAHDATIWRAATAASERADTVVEPMRHVTGVARMASVGPRESRTGPAVGSPPGTAPPTTTPLVLRV